MEWVLTLLCKCGQDFRFLEKEDFNQKDFTVQNWEKLIGEAGEVDCFRDCGEHMVGQTERFDSTKS
jgi:hypothetical protein